MPIIEQNYSQETLDLIQIAGEVDQGLFNPITPSTGNPLNGANYFRMAVYDNDDKLLKQYYYNHLTFDLRNY